MRLTKDVILFTTKEMPKWNPMNVCSYHLQEAGATPVQELAFALATAIGVLDAVKASGQCAPEEFGDVVGRISFFVNAGLRFVTEICKLRAFTELWDEITRERYGVTDAKQRLFRYGVQVNSLGLTEQQPENNVARILLEMLAVTLSKDARARAVQLPAWNEALGLPRPWDQQWSLRMQQILAYETDLLEYGDVFDGSPVIAAKVAELKVAAKDELKHIEEMGGTVKAVESGYLKQQLVESNSPPHRGDRARRADRGRRQPLHRNRSLAADRRRGGGRYRVGGRRIRSDRAACGLARGARCQSCRCGARRAAPRGQERRQYHAAVDRLRQSRRHHRRMGICVALRLRRIPRPDRRRHRHAQRRRGSRRHPRRSRSGVEEARPAPEISGRQARPRRPFQWRRTDRRARPRCRHGRGL